MTIVNFTHQSAMTQASCQANMVSALLVEVPPVWPTGQAVKTNHCTEAQVFLISILKRNLSHSCMFQHTDLFSLMSCIHVVFM